MFSDFLKMKRTGAGLSQTTLAGILDVSPQAIQHWERGAAKPDLSKVPALGRALGIPSIIIAQELLRDMEQGGDNGGVPFLAIDDMAAKEMLEAAPNIYLQLNKAPQLNPMAGTYYEALSNVTKGLEAFTGEPLSNKCKAILRRTIRVLKEQDAEIEEDAVQRAHYQESIEAHDEECASNEMDSLCVTGENLSEEDLKKILQKVGNDESAPDGPDDPVAAENFFSREEQLQSIYHAPPAYTSTLFRLYCDIWKQTGEDDESDEEAAAEVILAALDEILNDPIFAFLFCHDGKPIGRRENILSIKRTNQEKLYLACHDIETLITGPIGRFAVDEHLALCALPKVKRDSLSLEECYGECKYGKELLSFSEAVKNIAKGAGSLSTMMSELFKVWASLPSYYNGDSMDKASQEGKFCPVAEKSFCHAARNGFQYLYLPLDPRDVIAGPNVHVSAKFMKDDTCEKTIFTKNMISELKAFADEQEEVIVNNNNLNAAVTYLLPNGADTGFITSVLSAFGCIPSVSDK